MRVIFMGTPDFAVPALRAIAGRHDVAAVYTQPPRPAGRGQAERPSPVQRAAAALGLKVRHPATLRDVAETDAFRALHADVAVVVAYGLILPKAILAAPAKGCLNIHASLLPRWRGAAPIHRALLAGDAETGVSIMQMDEGLDTGAVMLHQATPIGSGETAADLHDRLAEMGAHLILTALDGIGWLPRTPQPTTGITYAAKIDKAEARIDWTRPAVEVDRQIRGLSPFPGAWCLAGEERLKLLRSRPVDRAGVPGQVLPNFTIACGIGAVEVLEAQREGKRPMAAGELMRGLALPERLG
jgi:methionyl-tRNA formyltransferase